MLKIKNNKGFTIVELMIATSVFSVIMMLSLYTFISISRMYTKGVGVIRTQDAARNLVIDISRQIQLTKSSVVKDSDLSNKYLCVGNKLYVYMFNRIEAPPVHAITSYDIDDNGTCPTSGSNPKHLLKPGGRVLEFSVEPVTGGTSSLYDLTVSLLFAPVDDPAALAIGEPGTNLVSGSAGVFSNWRCKGTIKGTEYCSISKITTSVYKRTEP